MTVVIQCAATKRANAGHLLTALGRSVTFVAKPAEAPSDARQTYVRPDDLAENGISWRQTLLNYNTKRGNNPLGLLPAFELYQNELYRRLVDRFGATDVYILSAGWGLIRADFLTPYYDITFSSSAEYYKRRQKKDPYEDFCMLPDNANDTVFFFGGKDYLLLFYKLTRGLKNKKIIFYNSKTITPFEGYFFNKFQTTTKTNWHYECVRAFLNDAIDSSRV